MAKVKPSIRPTETYTEPNFLRVYIVLLLFFSFFADVWIEEHVFLLVGATILMTQWRPTTAAAPARAR